VEPDLLVIGGDVVTMNTSREIAEATSVAIVDGVISALGDADRLRAAHPRATEIDATGCVVMPGLVDAHQHVTGDPLIRSTIPDDIDAQEAIFRWAVPVHAASGPADEEIGALLTAVECLLRGVTTIGEPGTTAHPEAVARGLDTAGIRARVGVWGWDAPGLPWSAPASAVLDRIAAVLDALPPSRRVGGWVTLVGHDLASDALFIGAAELAARTGAAMTWHLSPSEADGHAYLARTGARPVTHLHRLGVLGPRLVLGHAVRVDDDELAALLETGTAVAACPGAYLRLGQGYPGTVAHLRFLRAGGRLALGCDSHNAGDAPDVLQAARLFAGLARDDPARDDSARELPVAPPTAAEVLALATLGGADALGLAGAVGSIELGRRADLVVYDGTDPAWVPRGDEPTQLIWGAPSHSVRDVVVDGRIVVRDRKVTGVDLGALRAEAEGRRAALLRRAGIDPPRRWPRTRPSPVPFPGGAAR
jgi:5-methylthioadenosine/S-adenosylhomocysteine deaminase